MLSLANTLDKSANVADTFNASPDDDVQSLGFDRLETESGWM